MRLTFFWCLTTLIVIELGAYKFIGRPLLGPLFLRMKHAAKFLGRKKKQRAYNVRKDFNFKDIESSSEDEEESE